MFVNGVVIGTEIIAAVQVIIQPVPAVVLTVCIVVVAVTMVPGFAARRVATTTQAIAATSWASACASPSNNFHFMIPLSKQCFLTVLKMQSW